MDLFDPSRIYSLTEYGAFSAFLLVSIFYLLTYLSFPTILLSLLGFTCQLIIVTVSGLLFFVPLVGINQRMKQAKHELVIQANKDIKKLYLKIHSTAELEDYEVLGDLKNSLSTLQSSKAMIEKIPTWPWQPNTIRNLFAPFLIPIIVLLIQILIEYVSGI